MTKRKPGKMSATLLLIGLISSACSDSGSGSSTSDGADILVVGSQYEPTSLDAQLAESEGLYLATWSVNEALVDRSPDGELEAVLAEELPAVDPKDPNRWIVDLREGIEFTDGAPFDAEAVKFNVDRILDPDFGSTFAAAFGTLEGAEVVDDDTVALLTSDPDPILDYRLRSLRMVSPTAAVKDDYEEHPVGTGAYVVDSWKRGQGLTLRANEDYWGSPKPSIPTVEIRFIPDTNTRLSALQSGEIQMALPVPPSLTEGLDILKSSTNVSAGFMPMDTGEFPFSDPTFREALQLAIDSETLNEQLFAGLYSTNNCQPVVPGAGGFVEALGPPGYDPGRAKELLAEVGLPDDYVMKFEATSGVYNNDRELAEALAGFRRAIGLDVDTKVNEIDAYLDVIFNVQDTNAVILAMTDQDVGHGLRQVSHIAAPEAQVRSRADGLYPEIDDLVTTATTSLDASEQDAAMDEIWKTYCDENILLYFLDAADVMGVAPGLEYEPDAGQFVTIDFNRVTLP